MVDRELVERKLEKMEELLKELTEVKVNSFKEYSQSVILKRFVERNLELLVEQMVSVCRHIAARLLEKIPDSYSHCFELLAQKGIIPRENLETYKKMARFRNLLVHLYDEVDDAVVYSIYRERLSDFKLFIADIRRFLSTLPF
jgi:uncharacterized protein YutE (UPF0331/DUF86 family)